MRRDTQETCSVVRCSALDLPGVGPRYALMALSASEPKRVFFPREIRVQSSTHTELALRAVKLTFRGSLWPEPGEWGNLPFLRLTWLNRLGTSPALTTISLHFAFVAENGGLNHERRKAYSYKHDRDWRTKIDNIEFRAVPIKVYMLLFADVSMVRRA